MARVHHRRSGATDGGDDGRSGGFKAILGIREFRALWLANLQSMIGDQLARVALSVLVFQDTNSGFLTAGVYALTFLPALLGSVLLGHLADRLPKRGLLVGGDLIRAGLLAAMAVPQLPLWALVPLLVVAVVVGTPWQAAESALVSEILSGERYVLGVGLRSASAQGAQLAGFGVGGLVVGLIGVHVALAADAGTFAVSAVLIVAGVRSRRRARLAGGEAPKTQWLAGARVAFTSRHRRLLLGLAWLVGLVVVPEGLAAPYAAALDGPGHHAGTVGLLLAACPAGMLVGSIVYARWLPARIRIRSVGVLAVFSCVPLVFLYSEPGLPIALALLALSGLALAYQTQVMPEFVTSIAVAQRGQAIAIASAGMLAAQGVGLLIGGALSQVWGVGPAIAACGAAGVVAAAWLALARRGNQAARRLNAGPKLDIDDDDTPEDAADIEALSA